MRDKLYSYVLPQLLSVLSSKFGLSEEEFGFACIREKRYLRVEFTVEKYDIKIYWYEEPDCYRKGTGNDDWNTRYEPDGGKLRADVIKNIIKKIKISAPYLQEKIRENKRLTKELLKRVEALEAAGPTKYFNSTRNLSFGILRKIRKPSSYHQLPCLLPQRTFEDLCFLRSFSGVCLKGPSCRPEIS